MEFGKALVHQAVIQVETNRTMEVQVVVGHLVEAVEEAVQYFYAEGNWIEKHTIIRSFYGVIK